MTKTVKGTVVIDQVRCKGCNLCAVACPTGTLAMHPVEINDKGYHFSYMVHPENCIGCANCGLVCPDACITVYRAKK